MCCDSAERRRIRPLRSPNAADHHDFGNIKPKSPFSTDFADALPLRRNPGAPPAGISSPLASPEKERPVLPAALSRNWEPI
jgi:hypothetical protein